MGMKDSMGCWQEDELLVEKIICDYFGELFTSSGVSEMDIELALAGVEPKVDSTTNQILEEEFTEEEVTKVARGMNPTKAPGIDGLPALFYQKYWDKVNTDVISVCLRILNQGESVDCLNDTLIALTPKVDRPERIKQFRSISLCNVIYNIVAKCLADRMRRSLVGVVFETQSAFVPGRMIHDNAIVGYEGLHCIRKNYYGNGASLALKLDMAKAYDRVEWAFIEGAMLKMGYSNQWVDKIMRCVCVCVW